MYVTAQLATADRFRDRLAGFEFVDPLRSCTRLARCSIEQAHADYQASFFTRWLCMGSGCVLGSNIICVHTVVVSCSV